MNTPDRKSGTHQTGRKRDCIHNPFKMDDNTWPNYLYCKTDMRLPIAKISLQNTYIESVAV